MWNSLFYYNSVFWHIKEIGKEQDRERDAAWCRQLKERRKTERKKY